MLNALYKNQQKSVDCSTHGQVRVIQVTCADEHLDTLCSVYTIPV